MDAPTLLAQLTPRLKAVAVRRGGLALVLWGEAGIGKSWAASELLTGLGCRTFRAQAAQPLHAFTVSLPRPKRLPSWADASLKRLERGETLEPTQLVDTLSALIAALSPLVILIEDLHEAEPLRLELWARLAETVRHTRGVALLATSRAAPSEPFEGVRLTGLSEAATRALLEREAGALLPQAATGWIHARSEGNPLFALEYFRHLARMGLLWNDTRRWHWRAPPDGLIPITLEALIETFLFRSGAGTVRAVLEAAALLPPDVSLERLFKVAGVRPDDADTLRALSHSELFARGAFVHPLFREVVARSLTPARRRELARQALEEFGEDRRRQAGFIADAALEPERALAILEGAAEEAHAAGQPYSAALFGAQAVPYAEGESQVGLAVSAAEVLQRFDLLRATQLCEDVLQNPALSARAVQLYTQLLAQQGRMDEVEAFLKTLSPTLLAELDPASLLISRYHLAGNSRSVLDLWVAQPEFHTEPTLEVLRAVAGSALASGQVARAQALVEQGLSAAGQGERRWEFLSLKSLVFYHQGLYAEAEGANRELLALPELLDHPRARSSALVNRAAFLRNLGRYAEMSTCLDEALTIRRTSGDARAYAFAQAALAELYLEQGRYDEAEDLLNEALETLSRYGPSRFLTSTHAMASLLYSAQATPMSRLLALKHGEQALRYARDSGSPRMIRESLFEASVANTFAGTVQRGLDLADEAEALAEEAGDSAQDACRTAWARALALEALGEVGEAEACFRKALELARTVGLELEAQKLAFELARLAGDRLGAAARLEWFRSHGLGHGVNLVGRAFPELTAPASPTPSSAERNKDSSEKSGLSLEVLGSMRIVHQGRVQPVQGRKRRELLVLLLEARLSGRDELGQLALIDALYPDDGEDVALGALKQLVFQTRKALGDRVIVRTPGGYALGAVVSDAERFLKTRDTNLWRGLYLGVQETGSEAAVQDVLYDALRQEAWRVLEDDPQEAARLGRILLEADPYDADALRLTLRALGEDARSLEALYSHSRRLFAEVGETLPENWAVFLTASVL